MEENGASQKALDQKRLKIQRMWGRVERFMEPESDLANREVGADLTIE